MTSSVARLVLESGARLHLWNAAAPRNSRRTAAGSRRWLGCCAFWLAMLLAAPSGAQDWIYAARPGDNIWNLTEKHLKGIEYWKRLLAYNRLAAPDHILPGTRLRIPIRWLKVEPSSARIIAAQGDVFRSQGDGGASVPAVVGDELRSGDGIRTGTDSSVSVELADRSRLLVQGDSELVLDTLSAYGTTGMVDTSMRLQKGRVENAVEPAAGEASRYRITTPSAVVAVRGTHFRSAFDVATGTALGEVTEGVVAASGAGRAQRVPAGFGIRAVRGQALEPPRALLPAPDLAALPALADRMLVELEWPAVDAAAGYRVQLFPAGDPARLMLDLLVKAARVELDAPPDGDYRVRVRAVDTVGLEGLDAERALTIDARPVPPALLGPPAGALMHGTVPELWWALPEGAARFHLQVARDAAFSDLLLDRPAVDGVRLALAEEPPPAVYHWRVASIAAGGERGPFSDPRRFTIQVVPEATASSGSVTDAGVVIAWGRVANAREYEFQFASDETFTEGLVSETLSATEFTLPDVGAGTYFYRVRGVSGEGVAGPFGTVNRLEVPGEPLPPTWLLLLAPLLLLL